MKQNRIQILLDDKIFCPFTGKLIYDGSLESFSASKATLHISSVVGYPIEEIENEEEIFIYKNTLIEKFIFLDFKDDSEAVNFLKNKIDKEFENILHMTYIGFPGSYHISYNPNY